MRDDELRELERRAALGDVHDAIALASALEHCGARDRALEALVAHRTVPEARQALAPWASGTLPAALVEEPRAAEGPLRFRVLPVREGLLVTLPQAPYLVRLGR